MLAVSHLIFSAGSLGEIALPIVIPSEVEGSHEVAQFLAAFCAAFNFIILPVTKKYLKHLTF
jgi:hypothetical protein